MELEQDQRPLKASTCDGIFDCTTDEDDEDFCPHRFSCDAFPIKSQDYYENKTINYEYHRLSIPFDNKCDGKKDCLDGSDEYGSLCEEKAKSNKFSSEEKLIKYQVLVIFVWIMGILALAGNGVSFSKTKVTAVDSGFLDIAQGTENCVEESGVRGI